MADFFFVPHNTNMDDRKIFKDLLPANGKPLRIQQTRNIKDGVRKESIHVCGNSEIQFSKNTRAAAAMQRYRRKTGIREIEKEKDKLRKRKKGQKRKKAI